MIEEKNQFHPDKIKQAKEDAVARDKEINRRISDTIKSAQKCLANESFVKYRESYENLEKLIVEAWIGLTEPDAMKYTVKARGMALQLYQLRLLLNSVTADATKPNRAK